MSKLCLRYQYVIRENISRSRNNITFQVDFSKPTEAVMVVNVVIVNHEKLLFNIVNNTIK